MSVTHPTPIPQQSYRLSLWKGRMDTPTLPTPECFSPMGKIAALVAHRHGISLADLKGPSKRKEVAHPRQEAMHTLYQVFLADGRRRWSYPMIGRFLGGRDHSTVWHGVRAHARRAMQ